MFGHSVVTHLTLTPKEAIHTRHWTFYLLSSGVYIIIIEKYSDLVFTFLYMQIY